MPASVPGAALLAPSPRLGYSVRTVKFSSYSNVSAEVFLPGIRTLYLDDEDAERLYAEHPHLKASPAVYCPTCDKTGVYHWRGEDHPCDCEMQLQLHKHYLHSNIGETYQRLGWDDYEGPFFDELVDYLDNPLYVRRGIGLFMSGPKGTGKTMASNLVLKEFVKRCHTCYAVTFARAKEMFTAGWYSPEEQAYFARRILHSEILLLDDVLKEFRNRLTGSVLDDILRQRAQSGRPTLVTSNATEGEITSEYGGGILSLLREKSYQFMYFDGQDWRNNANQREKDEIARREVRPIQ
jgi:DNA replication protein DnaC